MTSDDRPSSVAGHAATRHGHGPPPTGFWEKVDKTETCWLWTGATLRKGYGSFNTETEKGAHRVSYEMHFGPIPKGDLVCHRCDSPACVNPDHLFLGSHADNLKDMASKDRGGRKLSNDDVLAIRSADNKGISRKRIAADFGVTAGLISQIVLRRARVHI